MRTVARIGAIVLTMATLSAGCAGQDRLGPAAPATPRVLTLTTGIGPGTLEQVAQELDRRSGGMLQIEFIDSAVAGDPDYEHLVIEAARHGDVDLAWVGSRAWGSIGITAFDALHAPFLVDSYDLEGRVLADAELLAPMAAALDANGLALVGILPGPMRLLFGRERAFVAPADLRGADVGINASRVAELTFAALGAGTEAMAFNGAPIDSADLIEQQASSVFNNGYDKDGGFLTSNVALWPRPIVLFASRRAYDALSDAERTMLRDSVAAVRGRILDETRQSEVDAARAMCSRGTTFVEASPADIAGLRAAVARVYDELRSDPVTADLIGRIEGMKAGASPDTGIPTCEVQATPDVGGVTPVDGTWTLCVSRQELLEAIHDPTRGEGAWESDADVPGNTGCAVMQFDRGVQSGAFDIHTAPESADLQRLGSYVVEGDRLRIRLDSGEAFVFGWRVFEDTLVLSQVRGEVSPTPAVVKPWERVEDR